MKTWHADRQCCRDSRPLVRRERFPVAGPGEAHERPRTVFFVLACTNGTLVGTEAVFERRERVVSVVPHMPEVEAEVTAVTRYRSLTRLEAAEPRTAPSRRPQLAAFLGFVNTLSRPEYLDITEKKTDSKECLKKP